jgi:hypothetical protein
VLERGGWIVEKERETGLRKDAKRCWLGTQYMFDAIFR